VGSLATLVLLDRGLGSAARIDFGNAERPPLLLAAGGEDYISPPVLNTNVLELQRKSPASTELKESGRPHFMAGLDGWQEIADDVLNWALEHRQAQAAAQPSSSSAQSP
jgi:hypothetical protein